MADHAIELLDSPDLEYCPPNNRHAVLLAAFTCFKLTMFRLLGEVTRDVDSRLIGTIFFSLVCGLVAFLDWDIRSKSPPVRNDPLLASMLALCAFVVSLPHSSTNPVWSFFWIYDMAWWFWTAYWAERLTGVAGKTLDFFYSVMP